MLSINYEFLKNRDIQKTESTDYQSKKSQNGLINNQKQNIDILEDKYECDICGKIFSERIKIIKHFKTALCYPEVVIVYKKIKTR